MGGKGSGRKKTPPRPFDYEGFQVERLDPADVWPEMLEGGPLPVIMGHQLRMREAMGFQTYIRTGNKFEAARQTGVHVSTIKKWCKLPWWIAMEQQFLKEVRRQTLVDVHRNHEKAVSTLAGVMDIKDESEAAQKTAQARVNAARTLLELGDDPVLNRRPNVQVNQNILHNHGTISIERLREQGTDKLLEMFATGKVPDEVIDHG